MMLALKLTAMLFLAWDITITHKYKEQPQAVAHIRGTAGPILLFVATLKQKTKQCFGQARDMTPVAAIKARFVLDNGEMLLQ